MEQELNNPFEATAHSDAGPHFGLKVLMAPWSSILLQKLIVAHLVKKFPAFCET
jgi:hypothetical protein